MGQMKRQPRRMHHLGTTKIDRRKQMGHGTCWRGGSLKQVHSKFKGHVYVEVGNGSIGVEKTGVDRTLTRREEQLDENRKENVQKETSDKEEMTLRDPLQREEVMSSEVNKDKMVNWRAVPSSVWGVGAWFCEGR